MNHLLFLVGLLFLAADSSAAQRPEGSAEAYAFVAPGVRLSDARRTVSGGGGGDWLATDWLMLGADAHFVGSWGCASCGSFVLTANVGFVRRPQRSYERWEPFVRIGFGGAGVSGGALPLAALAAGANYWRSERMGLRFEGRYETAIGGRSILHLRVGVVF